jgi:rhodanese-related sulfurtransferase
MTEPTNVTFDDAQILIRDGALLLDVREDHEWAAGRAPRARHVALAHLPDRLGELPLGVTIICICRSGGRSSRAAHFLAEQGHTVVNLEGGMMAWAASGGALEGDFSATEVL